MVRFSTDQGLGNFALVERGPKLLTGLFSTALGNLNSNRPLITSRRGSVKHVRRRELEGCVYKSTTSKALDGMISDTMLASMVGTLMEPKVP